MSDAPVVRGIVLCHGEMAAGMVDAVRRIAGITDDGLTPMSNQGLSPEVVYERVRELASDGPVILFTDLQSGSCTFAGRRLCSQRPDTVVISGVNLPMLLEFVLHRDLPLHELVQRVLQKGQAAICCAPSNVEQHAHRAVSRG